MSNLMESFKDIYLKELPIKLTEDYPTHIPVETMIEIVFKASKKAGEDICLVLKHFQFTDEEIRDCFERHGEKPKSKLYRKGLNIQKRGNI